MDRSREVSRCAMYVLTHAGPKEGMNVKTEGLENMKPAKKPSWSNLQDLREGATMTGRMLVASVSIMTRSPHPTKRWLSCPARTNRPLIRVPLQLASYPPCI
jgi:hypothetical protein